MDKLNELKALAELAQQLEDNGHYVEANTVHNQFIRLAQKKTHTVSQGESLSLIAKKNGVSVQDLMNANKLTKSNVYPGEILTIPSPVKPSGPFDFIQKGIDIVTDMFSGPKEETKKPMAPSQKKPMAPSTKPLMHEVLPGQSLSLIGKKYGIPWQKIQKDNGIEKSTDIFPGQQLVIKK
jgi:N-acetylmuramoyl-L-alanine amidase